MALNESHKERLDAMCDDKGETWDHSLNDVAMLLGVRDELTRLRDENAALRACVTFADTWNPRLPSWIELKRKAGL